VTDRDRVTLTDSDTASATYTINPQKVSAPVFSPVGGSFSSAVSVTISCGTNGAIIRYTTDGSEPSSTSTVYSGAISVSVTTTIYAKAFMSGMTDSDTSTATYTFVPGFEVLYHQVTYEELVFDVQTRSNSSVSSLTFNQTQKRIRFNVDGAAGTRGLCEITIPAELLSGEFTVYIDDASVSFAKTSNATHNALSINYDQSSHWVEVVGTEVIPEFEAWLFLPFVIAASLLGFALRKRNKKK
jgi:Chitobiase/beta-hexosaminidase C-terminal domain